MAFGDILKETTENGDSTEDPVSLTLSGSPTAGNLILMRLFAGDGPMAAGSGMTEAVELHDVGQDDATGIYFRVAESGDGATWTVDLPAADQYAAVLQEVEGAFEASPLDQTGSTAAADDQTTQAVTAASATSQADEFVAAAWGHRSIAADSNSVEISSVNNSFTGLINEHSRFADGARKSLGAADKVLSATDTPSVTATFSAATGRTSAVLATFKKSGGSPPATSILRQMMNYHGG